MFIILISAVLTGTIGTVTVHAASDTVTLGFAGDLNFSENWCTMQHMNSCPGGFNDCITPAVSDITRSFDIFMVNNEFTYSTRGTPLSGKAYTFRADPSRVKLLDLLGTDIVLLANNHVYDYGPDAFFDTVDTLSSDGIPYVGAGRNSAEAAAPVYFNKNGIRIAYVAATRAEKNIMTPAAGADSPGVLRSYDDTEFLNVIRTAASDSDYVVASIHWGTEYSSNADSTQRRIAHELIDAGADAVIGTHPHVLQGIEYYNDKPIIYSLGNFWFNEKSLYSCIYEIELNQDATLKDVKFIPCIQSHMQTSLPSSDSARISILDYEENISYNAKIDDLGFVTSE